MTQIYGPYDQDDFKTMQLLKENITYYRSKDPAVFGDTANQYKNMLKGMFQKAA
jgi:hypothetical protein